MRVLLRLSYDGACFSGFQVQKNAPSVQEALCRALETLSRTAVPVSGCSRTDAGVHAKEFFCHADLPFDTLPKDFLKGLNALLPDGIGVFELTPVADGFHARYHAKKKTYRYYFYVSPARRPLLDGRALHVRMPLDLAAMRRAAEQLVGTHDFRCFQAAGSQVTDTVRTVFSCSIQPVDETLFYLEISADGFLYRMVRNVMGTLLDIGKGKDYSVPRLLKEGDRTLAGVCAAAHGLYLWRVDYE